MGVPKRRVSKTRKNKRRAQWKISAPKLVSCPHCHQLMVPHRVCKNCGYYDGRQVVNIE